MCLYGQNLCFDSLSDSCVVFENLDVPTFSFSIVVCCNGVFSLTT